MAKKVVAKKEKEVEKKIEDVQTSSAPVEEKAVEKKNIKKVIFTRKNGSTREFNEALHGDGFVAIADEFAKTNEKFIAERQDL